MTIIKKCPYCFEEVVERSPKCPHCNQYMIDPPLEMDFKNANKKKCFFCGKLILLPAIVCKHCHRWLDEVNRAVSDLEDME